MPATLTPTFETGAKTKPGEVLSVTPGQAMTDEDLAALQPDSDLNVAFVVDQLSAMLTHARCGTHLYRSVAARSNNPVLQSRYQEMGTEVEQQVEILEQLVSDLGGDPQYVSPYARAVQGMDTKLLESTFLLSGSIDVMTQEAVLVDALLVAESVDHANWRLLVSLGDQAADGPMGDAFAKAIAEAEPRAGEHLGYVEQTREKMVSLQAKSSTMAAMGAKAEELVEKVRSWFA